MDRLRRHLQDLRVAKQVPTPALYVVEHWLGFTYLLEASKAPCKLVYSLPPSCVVKVKRCASSACSTASYRKARNPIPCGRPAFAGPASCVCLPSQLTEVFHKTVGISHKTVKGLHKTVGGLPQGAVRHRSRLRSCRPSRARFSDVPHRSSSSCTIPSTKTHQIGAKSGQFSFITTGASSSYTITHTRS